MAQKAQGSRNHTALLPESLFLLPAAGGWMGFATDRSERTFSGRLLMALARPMRTAMHGTLAVHTLPLGLSNAFLIESEAGVTLVDAGLPGAGPLILDALKRIGRSSDLKLIVVTHAHIDHYGGAKAVHKATGAPIAVHSADADDLATGTTQLGTVRSLARVSAAALPLIERPLKGVEPVAPDLLLADGDRLDDCGVPAVVLHTPGHTPGHTSLLLDGGILFAGDLVSGTGRPHAQSAYAFDWGQLACSLRRVQTQKPAVVYAGHGRQPIGAELFQALEVKVGSVRTTQPPAP